MMRSIAPLAVALTMLGCIGCTGTQARGPATDYAVITPPPDDLRAGCPLGVPDTRVQITDTRQGVVLTFTTWNRIDELRHRVRDSAAMRGPRAHLGLGHAGRHDLGQGHGLRLADMPVGRASVEDVELGARLRLDAPSALQVERLQSQIRNRIEEIRLAHPCD